MILWPLCLEPMKENDFFTWAEHPTQKICDGHELKLKISKTQLIIFSNTQQRPQARISTRSQLSSFEVKFFHVHLDQQLDFSVELPKIIANYTANYKKYGDGE